MSVAQDKGWLLGQIEGLNGGIFEWWYSRAGWRLVDALDNGASGI